jgi:excinuclease ABC subunit C
MMGEVLTRRFASSDERKFASLPELLIVDGGKGQLGVALEALREAGLSDRVALAALAKEHEWLFVPGRSEPIVLSPSSKARLLVTHLRDEAHRFAVDYHRTVRQKALKKSMLDEAPGIGKGRRQALLQHFGSLSRLTQASVGELAEVEGIGPRLAQQLHAYLNLDSA